MGSNFAVRREVFWQVGGFSHYDETGLAGDDIYLSLRLSRLTRVVFDPNLVVYASPRRVREGYVNFLWRSVLNVVWATVLKEPPLPTPDIR